MAFDCQGLSIAKFKGLNQLLDSFIDDMTVIRFFYEDDASDVNIDGEAFYRVIIGYTMLGSKDAVVHSVDVDDLTYFDDVFDEAERSVHYDLLSNLINKYGFQIVEKDQLVDGQESEDLK